MNTHYLICFERTHRNNEMGDVVEDFYGVYLLYCTNPKFKGRTYIGFTVDPNRRIKQHNRGIKAGGAYRTCNKGPWEMVLIVHGFPNDVSALRFEWAWQHPDTSRRLKSMGPKKSRETKFEFCLRVLAVMLNTRPWARLPLTLRWLKQEFFKDFPPGMEPPNHMPIAYGPVAPQKVTAGKNKKRAEDDGDDDVVEDLVRLCTICELYVEKGSDMKCLSPRCHLLAHPNCIAKHFLKTEPMELVPLEGECPMCQTTLLWGDLVRLKKGCYRNLGEEEKGSHWTDSLSQVPS